MPVSVSQKDRLANYLSHGIEHVAACNAVGCSLVDLQELLKDEMFVASIEAKEHTRYADNVDVDTIYDRLEKTALENLEKAMKISYDPDLALRVAVLSNRAQRRNPKFGDNVPLQPNEAKVVNLSLCVSFVKQIQNNNNAAPGPKQITLEKGTMFNEVDYATPQQVEQLVDGLSDFMPSSKKMKTTRLLDNDE